MLGLMGPGELPTPTPPKQRLLGNQISAQPCPQVGKYWEQLCRCSSAVYSGQEEGPELSPFPG